MKETQQVMKENEYLRSLAVGTFETIKLMPGYEEAMNSLKEKIQKDWKTIKENKLKTKCPF
jgi:hypothetical protein